MIALTKEQQELAEKHIALVYYVSGRYAHIPEKAYEELVSKLMLRLCKAIQSFDPDRGIKISSYLVKSLEGEAKNYFRDDVWMVRPPRAVREKALSLEDEDEEDLEDKIRSCVSPVSLDASVSGNYGDYQLELADGEELIEDQIVNKIGGAEIVRSVFNALQPEEKFLLGCQMDGSSLTVVQEHFRVPPTVAKEAWEELKEKAKVLYTRALDDLPLEESTGNKALRNHLVRRFVPPEENFVEVRKRLANEKQQSA